MSDLAWIAFVVVAFVLGVVVCHAGLIG